MRVAGALLSCSQQGMHVLLLPLLIWQAYLRAWDFS